VPAFALPALALPTIDVSALPRPAIDVSAIVPASRRLRRPGSARFPVPRISRVSRVRVPDGAVPRLTARPRLAIGRLLLMSRHAVPIVGRLRRGRSARQRVARVALGRLSGGRPASIAA
jgi:hypothetical protein